MHWDFAIILIVLAVAVPVLGRRRVQQLVALPDTTKSDRLSLYASTIAFQWLAAGIVLWRTMSHGIRPLQLGLALAQRNLIITTSVVLCTLFLLNQLLSIKKLSSQPFDLNSTVANLALKIFPRDAVERLAFFALVATVAVCEEFIYRGFVQRVFENWSRSTLIGVFASAALFALAHLYQGRRGVVSTFAVGILFSGVRAWTGSLIPSITAHFVADITVGLLLPTKMRSALSAQTPSSQSGSDPLAAPDDLTR